MSKCIATKLLNLRQGTHFTYLIHTSNFVRKDYYKTLKIEADASPNEVKEAYLKLTKEYHPDVNQSKDAKQVFQEITEAYEVLGSEKGRHEYDNKFTSRLKRLRRKKKRTPNQNPDTRSYEDIHKIVKERHKGEMEMYREWARKAGENTWRAFENQKREEDIERRRKEKQTNSKNTSENFSDILSENEKKKKEKEKEERDTMKMHTLILTVTLIVAIIFEKYSSC